MDDRIQKLIKAAQELSEGNYQVEVPITPPDEVGQLGKALRSLAQTLEQRYQELAKLNQITARINSGLLLDQILEEIYNDFRPLIPYNRIGLALLEENGRLLRAQWAKTNRAEVRLEPGYAAPMAGSSLESIMSSHEPRILNNLPEYLAQKPASESTRLIVEEGYQSSLTCPLIANGLPVGFIFFSSVNANTYAHAHVEIFKQIAEQLSVIVEKGRLVSDLAEKSELIEKQNEELRRLNNLKNLFLGMAVHDLRNPIANIQLVSDVMLGDGRSPLTAAEQRDFIKDINVQARFMAELIGDILNLAEIEAGQLKLVIEEIDLAGFMKTIVRYHNKLASLKGTRVVLVSRPSGTMRADAQRMRQTLDNLVSNAIKYSPPGSTVRVRVSRTGAGWHFEVQDEGPGISEKDQVRLFQDFARLSARPTGGEKSTGLGLAIARRMVEAHGGQIGVDSTTGQGATFWFNIP
jgi:signal transduction histidine kinase